MLYKRFVKKINNLILNIKIEKITLLVNIFQYNWIQDLKIIISIKHKIFSVTIDKINFIPGK